MRGVMLVALLSLVACKGDNRKRTPEYFLAQEQDERLAGVWEQLPWKEGAEVTHRLRFDACGELEYIDVLAPERVHGAMYYYTEGDRLFMLIKKSGEEEYAVQEWIYKLEEGLLYLQDLEMESDDWTVPYQRVASDM